MQRNNEELEKRSIVIAHHTNKIPNIFTLPQKKVPNRTQTNKFIVSEKEEKEREKAEKRHFLGKAINAQEKEFCAREIIIQNMFKFLKLKSIKNLRHTNKYICMLVDRELKNQMKYIIVGTPSHSPTESNNRRFAIHIKNEEWTAAHMNHAIEFIEKITLNLKGIYIEASKINNEFLNKILAECIKPNKCKKLKIVHFQFKKEFYGDEGIEPQCSYLAKFFDNDIAPSLEYIIIDADFGFTNKKTNKIEPSYPTYEIYPLLNSFPQKENISIKKIKLIAAIPDSSFLKYCIKNLKKLKKLTLNNCNIEEIQNETFEKERNETSALKEFKITQLTFDYDTHEFSQFFSVKSLETFLTLCPKINNIYIDTLILGLDENDFDNFLSLIKNISGKINHIKFSPNITNTLEEMIKNNKTVFDNKLEKLKKELESMDFNVSFELNLDNSENDDELCGGLYITIDKK